MSDAVRAFLAVELPAPARDQVAGAIAALRGVAPEGVRWGAVANLHLTLRFLGQVERARLASLLDAAGPRLRGLRPFEVRLAGAGAFPNARAARVLWLGVDRGAGELARVARKLDAAARRAGLPAERRPFRAHLTVGRAARPVRVALERARLEEGEPFPVSEVVLYESRLSSGGASYVPLARLVLGAEDSLSDNENLAPDIQESIHGT